MQMKPIELIKKAQEKRTARVIFDIPLDEPLPAMLTSVDGFEVIELQEIIKAEKYEALRKRGLDKYPMNEDEWEAEVRDTIDRLKEAGTPQKQIDATVERLQKNKPKNRAAQMSDKHAGYRLIQEIIPRYLRDPKTEELLFPDQESQEQMRRFICSDPEIMTFLATEFGKLNAQKAEIGEAAKNSSKQESSASGKSGNSVQEPGDTDLRSAKS